MPFVQRRYFTPTLVDENLPWLPALKFGDEVHLPAGTLFTPKDYDLIFVKSGYARFFCNTNNKANNFILIAGRNSLVNVGGVITGANRFSHLTVEGDTDIVVFDSYILWDTEFAEMFPELYMSMAKTLAKTVNMFSERAHDICFYPCLERMCRILLSITSDLPYNSNTQYVKTCTQNDLAHLAGMHYVTASRVLKSLRDAGIIGKIYPYYIEVLNYKALKELSELKATL